MTSSVAPPLVVKILKMYNSLYRIHPIDMDHVWWEIRIHPEALSVVSEQLELMLVGDALLAGWDELGHNWMDGYLPDYCSETMIRFPGGEFPLRIYYCVDEGIPLDDYALTGLLRANHEEFSRADSLYSWQSVNN
jgi:hypothetical protein